MQVLNNEWNIKQQEVQKSNRCQECCRQMRLFSNYNSGSCSNEDDAEETCQKWLPRYPRGPQPRCDSRVHKMLHSESHKGQCKEISPKLEEWIGGFALV